MSGGFYEKAASKFDIQLSGPHPEEQTQIDRIIFNELNLGSSISQENKQYMRDIISRYPADGIILGCTELDMIIKPEDVLAPYSIRFKYKYGQR